VRLGVAFAGQDTHLSDSPHSRVADGAHKVRLRYSDKIRLHPTLGKRHHVRMHTTPHCTRDEHAADKMSTRVLQGGLPPYSRARPRAALRPSSRSHPPVLPHLFIQTKISTCYIQTEIHTRITVTLMTNTAHKSRRRPRPHPLPTQRIESHSRTTSTPIPQDHTHTRARAPSSNTNSRVLFRIRNRPLLPLRLGEDALPPQQTSITPPLPRIPLAPVPTPSSRCPSTSASTRPTSRPNSSSSSLSRPAARRGSQRTSSGVM
jgi:hypothetical protein